MNSKKQSKKYITPISELIKERNSLHIKKDNPERLKELIAIINYFYYGIC